MWGRSYCTICTTRHPQNCHTLSSSIQPLKTWHLLTLHFLPCSAYGSRPLRGIGLFWLNLGAVWEWAVNPTPRGELIGTTEYLTPWARCRIYRCRYNRVRLHLVQGVCLQSNSKWAILLNVPLCKGTDLYLSDTTHVYWKPNWSYVFRSTLTLILRRSRTGTVWFYTSTGNKRAARPKLYTKSLTRDLKRMYSRFTLVRISINL